MKATVKLPRFIAHREGLASREFEGEVIRHTAKGILLRGQAVVSPSDTCRRCGRRITHPASLLVGYGPECSQYLGIPRDFTEDEVETIKRQAQQETTIERWFPKRYAQDEGGNPWSAPVEDEETFTIDSRLDGENIVLSFPYNREAVDRVKLIPGARFDGDTKDWGVPLGEWSEAQRFVRAFGCELHPDIIAQGLDREHEKPARAALSAKRTSDLEVRGLNGTLRPFQKAGVEYAVTARRVIIGDEPGLGKTIQAIAAVRFLKTSPTIVVCPANVKFNWQNEIESWLPDAVVHVVEGKKKYALPKAEWYIVNYEVLQDHRANLLKLRAPNLILDEVHKVKNPKAQRSRAVTGTWQGSKQVEKGLKEHAENIIALTGTVIVNRPSELINPLTILDRLDEFGGWHGYVTKYCAAFRGDFGWDISGASNLDELHRKLRETCYVRREKSDVLSELPPKQIAHVRVDITNRSEYQRAETDFLEFMYDELKADPRVRAEYESGRSSLQKIIGERLDRIKRNEQLVKLGKLREVTGKGKVKAAKEWIADFLESGEKLVVAAWHQRVIKELHQAFPDAVVVTGKQSSKQKQLAVDTFQNDEDCKLILINIQSGGVGITLTKASNALFVEYDWTPGNHQQAEDRIHRITQTEAVTIWYTVAKGTMDEYALRMLAQKERVTNAVNRGRQTTNGFSSIEEGAL